MTTTDIPFIDFVSTTLGIDMEQVRTLYSSSQALIAERSLSEEILKKVSRASSLIKLSDKLQSLMDEESGPIYAGVEVDTLRIALLVSAIESIGTQPRYKSFKPWYIVEKFSSVDEIQLTRENFESDWDNYNENFGSFQAFYKAVQDFGPDNLLKELVLARLVEKIEVSDGLPESELRYKKYYLPVSCIENVERLISDRVILRKNNMERYLVEEEGVYHLEDMNRRRIQNLNDLSEINDYRVALEDIANLAIQIKEECFEQQVKRKMRTIYGDIRSDYYHAGRERIRTRYYSTSHLIPDDNSVDERRYWVRFSGRLVSLFRQLACHIIFGFWENSISDQ